MAWSKTGLITAARGGAGWTNETAYVARHSGVLRINPPGEKLIAAGSVGTATVLLDNTTQRFSWMRSDKPLYEYIGGPVGMAGIPIRIYAGYITASGPEYVRIFTGIITGWSEKFDSTVELQCSDWGFRYLQNKQSTVVSRDKLPNEWITIVAGLAGITAGLMDLDVGIYQIPWCWMDDESIVDEIWDAASADGGLAWFDQNGLLIYRNSLAWIGLSSVWVFDEGTYTLAEPEIDLDPTATRIKVEWSGRLAGPDAAIYALETYKTILPAQQMSWVARFNHAVTRVNDPNSADPYNDYFAVSGGGMEMTAEITVAITAVRAQQCRITVTNNSAVQAARLVALRLRGQPLLGGPTEQIEVLASFAPFDFDRIRSERGNAYCQTQEQGEALANLLALHGQRVRPAYNLQNVPGVPHLELGDLVTFKDSRSVGSGQSVYGLTAGMSWEFGGNAGYKQNYTLMDVTGQTAYSNYFVIGTSKLGGPFTEMAPEATYGRLFY